MITDWGGGKGEEGRGRREGEKRTETAASYVTFARALTFAQLFPTSAQLCHSTSIYSTSTSFIVLSQSLRLEKRHGLSSFRLSRCL